LKSSEQTQTLLKIIMENMGNLIYFNAHRVIEELKELQSLTGDKNGAQRVAWTQTWQQSRDWLAQKLEELPVSVEIDPAGNTWATLPGSNNHTLIFGSHIDSVPDGGWLDGCLGVLAGLEVLRAFAKQGTPDRTIRLVSWADEEGARFGRSLFGSSALSGNFDPQQVGQLVDKNGVNMKEAALKYGVDIDRASLAANQLNNAYAYLELHIEQGPVLVSIGLPLGVVIGTLGVERKQVRFTGQAAHAGSTPMEMRRDALAGAARLALELREIARRHGGVCTMGSVVTHPGIVTAVAGQCDCLLDQRHLDAAGLNRMLADAYASSHEIAQQEGLEVEWKPVYRIEPVAFNEALTDLCAEAVAESGLKVHRMPSGPLHDAVEMARAGIPTAMLFVQSLNGLSHTKEEDTLPAHLLLAANAFYSLVNKTLHTRLPV
jgi:N-carbamoyl-L-amino-acid hydrolase